MKEKYSILLIDLPQDAPETGWLKEVGYTLGWSLNEVSEPDTIIIDARGGITSSWTKEKSPLYAPPMIALIDPDSEPVQEMENIVIKELGKENFLQNIKVLTQIGFYKKRILKEKSKTEEVLSNYTDMISIIVHDIRNPLAAVLANLNYIHLKLEEKGDPNSLSEAIIDVESASEGILEILNDFQDIARIKAGRLKLTKSPIQMREFIEEIANKFISEVQLQDVKFFWSLTPSDFRFTVDRRLLGRVITRLLKNSGQYTPAWGEIRLDVKLESHLGLRIEICDTGPIVPSELRADFFDHKEQIKIKKRASSRYSRGLGFYFCKLAIEVQGGKIWVQESQDKRENMFIVVLPPS
jgi:K+-sensing histidine kinase KdpD